MSVPRGSAVRLLVVLALALCLTLFMAGVAYAGQWVTGDTHNHTHFSDGNQYLPTLVHQAFDVYGLDWMGSTDHGGEWDRDANGVKYTANTVGNRSGDIWAWDGMLDNWDSFNALRGQHPGKVLFQGLEWGVPGIDESKTVIVDAYQQPGSPAPTYATGMAISDFEFLFDKLDDDFTQRKTLVRKARGTTLTRTGLTKDSETYDKYARGLEAANFLGSRYTLNSYSILSHPSRDLLWTALDIRRYNDAAPTVFFGMAGMPGSQKEPPLRGGYDEEFFNDDGSLNEELTAQARTYGGADYFTAKVGGVWDSLLGEGRHFWVFCDSDFHETDEEFWPGEYSKDHTFVGALTPQGIVDGLRSGNSFAVEGQLIDGLDFKATSGAASATMGETLTVEDGDIITITVTWHSPAVNNNGDVPEVDHVDLISGNVTGKLSPSDIGYATRVTNPSTGVVETFYANSASYTIEPTADMYFRLRGTNQPWNNWPETAEGNPLSDDTDPEENNADKAWADLWFYSNPIFIDVQ
jgi:hypothetical protein